MENPSLELRSPEAFAAMTRHVLDDALARFMELAAVKTLGPAEFANLDVYSFKQTWPDASCGFGGIAAQVITDAQTVVVSCADCDAAMVYICGQFAYLVDAPSQAFWDAVGEHVLPGADYPRERLSR